MKCPNCGSVMKSRLINSRLINSGIAACCCTGCRMHGPIAEADTDRGAICKATRLMREWIEDMDKERGAAIRKAYRDGIMKAAKHVESTLVRKSLIKEA